jgi:hypothetical protein
MDQETGSGHITRAAVPKLFMSGPADAHGRTSGMNEDQYYRALNRTQETKIAYGGLLRTATKRPGRQIMAIHEFDIR